MTDLATTPTRTGNLKVIVRQSDEPLDIEAWTAQYVRALIQADRAAQRQREAA